MNQDEIRRFATEHDLPLPDGTASDTSLDELCGRDRLLRFALLRPLLDRPGGCPEELLFEVKTIGDVVAWSAGETRSHVPTSAPEAHDPLIRTDANSWPFATARVALRPLEPPDYDLIYQSINALHTGYRWPSHGRSIGPAELEASLRQQAIVQQVAFRIDDYRPVGFYTLAASSEPDRRAELSVFGLQGGRTARPDATPFQVLEGLALFISSSFRLFDYRKLIAEIPGWNWPQFESGADQFFCVEGEFAEHDYLDGRWWTRRSIAIFRDEWLELEPALRASLSSWTHPDPPVA